MQCSAAFPPHSRLYRDTRHAEFQSALRQRHVFCVKLSSAPAAVPQRGPSSGRCLPGRLSGDGIAAPQRREGDQGGSRPPRTGRSAATPHGSTARSARPGPPPPTSLTRRAGRSGGQPQPAATPPSPPPGRRARPRAAPRRQLPRAAGPPAPPRPSGAAGRRPAPGDAPPSLSCAARAPRVRLRQRRAYPEPRGRPPRRGAYTGALAPPHPPGPRARAAPRSPHLRARRPPGAPRGLTGAGPARRSSGPSSDGKWRALLLLLMDGGATPATRGVSRNCFQGPLLHPLRNSRSGRAAGGSYETWEAGRAVLPGDQ